MLFHKLDLAEYLVEEYNVSVKRTCSLVSLSRSVWYYKSQKNDELLIAEAPAAKRPLPYCEIPAEYDMWL